MADAEADKTEIVEPAASDTTAMEQTLTKDEKTDKQHEPEQKTETDTLTDQPEKREKKKLENSEKTAAAAAATTVPPSSTEGKRERKKTERLEFTAADLTQKKLFEIPAGFGTLLAECPVVDHNLQSVKAEDLKVLHKLLFKTPGQLQTIKKNIRKFNGFAFEKNSAEYDKKMLLLLKQVLVDLKRICLVLDLEKSGTKEEVCAR